MNYKKCFPYILFYIIVLSCINIPVTALRSSPTFRLGDCSVPVDEDDFIEYDFETADGLTILKVSIVDIYQLLGIFDCLAVNISVDRYNTTTNKYTTLILDSLEFENQQILAYNKTMQYFQFNESMQTLLTEGYGGYYFIPNEPVDVNIVKTFIESQTAYTASIQGNTITIDINNDQAILTYNELGILSEEQIKQNDQIVSTLKLKLSEPIISFSNFFILILLASIIGLTIKRYRMILSRKSNREL
ncbi:MAG: hypothetical protein ACFE9R_18475 [Candidatus Hermodarchaeota archaeon]